MMILPLFLLCGGCGGRAALCPEAIPVEGRWDSQDSRITARKMASDCLSKPWYGFYSERGVLPRVMLGEIRVKDRLNFNTQEFIRDVEQVLINSGKIEYLVQPALRNHNRGKNLPVNDEGFKDVPVQTSDGEVDAELLLCGKITTYAEAEGSETVLFCHIQLQLIDIQSNRMVWLGSEEIRGTLSWQ
jgi:hypothetical protein